MKGGRRTRSVPNSVTLRHQMTPMKLDLRRKSEPSPRRIRQGRMDDARSFWWLPCLIGLSFVMGGPRSGSMYTRRTRRNRMSHGRFYEL